MTVTSLTEILTEFFDWTFGEQEGYVCIATQLPNQKETFKQIFFRWPDKSIDLVNFIEDARPRRNVWFCVNLLDRPERKKPYCLRSNLVWADLDAADPQIIDPPPQCLIESSPLRYQAIWRLEDNIDSTIAEAYSKKIAYAYKAEGVDPSGWDLTQLLRVPTTHNFKYPTKPQVLLLRNSDVLAPVAVFEQTEAVAATPTTDTELIESDAPTIEDLPPAEGIIYKYRSQLQKTAFFELLNSDPPDEADWSKLLWRLVNICIEAGMSKDEAYACCLTAKCNKYARDNRSPVYLWREITKADLQQERITAASLADFKPLVMPKLLEDDELSQLPRTFIEDYCDWASAATDAVPEYHELCAFILLSSLLSAGIKIPIDYAPQGMVPNLWGLLLGDSTLTRKTTAMQMAMSFLGDINPELVLATDGSAEGILSGLSGRPNRVSIYFKDEVAGFFESMMKKEYLAGMQETLTQLYDVPQFYTRRLRKEVINITNPVFIFFGGGIKDKVYSLVSEQQILSGFIPRFLIVSGESDLSRIKRSGPPTQTGTAAHNELKTRLADLYEVYSKDRIISIGGVDIEVPSTVNAILNEAAWARYGEIENKMVQAAYASPISMTALPTFERLSRSLLKMSALLAATRKLATASETEIEVRETDVMVAAKYVQKWGRHTIDLITNSGKGTNLRLMEKIVLTIRKNPGIARSRIMQHHNLTKREMDEVVGTLIDRGEVVVKSAGRGQTFWGA